MKMPIWNWSDLKWSLIAICIISIIFSEKIIPIQYVCFTLAITSVVFILYISILILLKTVLKNLLNVRKEELEKNGSPLNVKEYFNLLLVKIEEIEETGLSENNSEDINIT